MNTRPGSAGLLGLIDRFRDRGDERPLGAAILDDPCRAVYPLAALLRALSAGHLAVWRVRERWFRGRSDPEALSVPVVSVGNLTVGGTGKTPLVTWVARELLGRGRRPGILSRGYGGVRAEGGPRNDEFMVIRELLPEVPQGSGKRRASAGRALLESHPEVDCIILDDGFQHRRIRRDLDLVVIDAILPFGFGRLLPGGLLREPIEALGRADGVIISRADLCHPDKVAALESYIRGRFPGTPLARMVDRPIAWRPLRPADREIPPQGLGNLPVYLACGIGHPAAFFRRVQAMGARVVGRQAFRDHFPFPSRAVRSIEAQARRRGAEAVMVTTKDRVKIPAEILAMPWYDLRIDVEVRDPAGWVEDALDCLGEDQGGEA